MKRLLYLFSFCLLFSSQSFAFEGKNDSLKIYHLPKGVTSKDYLPNALIIKYKDNPVQSLKTFDTNTLTKSIKLTLTYKKQFFVSGDLTKITLSDQKRVDQIGLNRIYQIGYSNQISVEDAINEILKDATIEYAEPSFIYNTFVDPNDPSYVSGLQNYLIQVSASQAWTVQPNANGVIIAIVDSGSDLQHQDLSNNIYYNLSDPINGIDDDGDGYLDNYNGWDFVGRSASNIVEDNNPDIPADSLDHGVHVSGLASAVTNNGIGISSIAQTAKLMILKVGADNNARAIYRGYDGIVYAANHGAKIINCSWGGPGGGAFGQDVINYAISKGCLVVAAAGNGGNNESSFPAAYQGAFAVANVKFDDIKAASSSYGFHVAISAPGNSIYSTVNGSLFGYKSGTSMATPIVSSAAALVWAKYPTLTAIQIGEILRLNSDEIYSLSGNSSYINQLGKGRLNVYKALLNGANSPSIKKQKITITDHSFGSYAPGDTLLYYFDLKNILQNTNNLSVTLTSSNQNISILNSNLNAGAINTNQTKTVGPFKVLIKQNTLDNTSIIFNINYSDAAASYQDNEIFTTIVNLDYQNIKVNKVYSTITSNGKIGFSGDNATDGLGFIYKDFDLLYEASLMIGNSATIVSNNARAVNGAYDHHFQKVLRVSKLTNSNAAYEGIAGFNDLKSNTPLVLTINNRMMAYQNAPDDKYIIAEYEITNSNSEFLNNVYVGLFTDWDVDEGDKNLLRYDEGLRLAYCYASTPLSPYAGVKLLSASASPAFYPMSSQIPGDFQEDGNFTIAEKFATLSNGIKSNTLGTGTGIDVMFTSGYGPYNLAPNQTVKVAFAFLAGEDLTDIKTSALAAQAKYGQITTAVNPDVILNQFSVSQNYPNPATSNTNFTVYLPSNGKLNIELYDLTGKKIKTLFNSDLKKGSHEFAIDANLLNSGIYFYKTSFEGLEKVMKMVVMK